MSASSSIPVTPERIFQLAWGYAPPLILEAAMKHHVFDVLDAGPMSLSEVSAATSASPRGLAAIMDALVGLNFLAKNGSGKYELTPESAAFLVSTKPSFQGGLIRHTSEHLLPKWLHLNEIVATGKPDAAVNQQQAGIEFFEKFVNDIFPMSYPAASVLAAHLELASRADRFNVLDLGAGSGVWGIAQAQTGPMVYITAVDWPGVLSITRANAARFGLAERFTFVEGDLLEAPFGTGHNLVTIGHILHSEGIERSKALLKKSFAALASGGAIAIAEFLVNADRTGPVNGLIFAVNMLVNTDTGGTYSFEEIGAWLSEVGFVNIRQLDSPGPSPLVLASKP
jgi:precorrin-6B methylase 2